MMKRKNQIWKETDTSDMTGKESYEIFYSVELNKFILVCDASGDTCCFEVSEEEFHYIFRQEDVKKLDMIANACSVMGSVSPRFLCSKNEMRNHTVKQMDFAETLLQEIRNCKG